MCEHCTRREFLGAGAVSGLLLAGATWAQAGASESPPAKPRGKSRICVVFTGTPQPEDRNWGADVKQIEAVKARLAEAEKKLGNIELVVGHSTSPQETAVLLEKAGPEAPVLAINVQNFSLTRVVAPILESERPMAVRAAGDGHDWRAPGSGGGATASPVASNDL